MCPPSRLTAGAALVTAWLNAPALAVLADTNRDEPLGAMRAKPSVISSGFEPTVRYPK